MKIAIVNSSELAKGGCGSAIKFAGNCSDCHLVHNCKDEQAKLGRLILARQKVRKIKEQLREAQGLLEKCKEDLL